VTAESEGGERLVKGHAGNKVKLCWGRKAREGKVRVGSNIMVLAERR